jgi:hypothetical protein
MSIREKLNESRTLSITVAAVVFAIALVLIFRQLHEASPHRPGLPSKTFYSDDDGKTWFLDEFMKITPFDHNGHPAYKAVVYRCNGGTPAVAYLEKFSDSQQAAMKEISPENVRDYTGRFMSFQEELDVKKPGSNHWLSVESRGYIDAKIVTCPDGSVKGLTFVSPLDPDTGASG